MRLVLVCVGRSKAGPEKDLAARYIDRAGAAGRAIGFTNVELRELEESRARRGEDRKAEEAKAILAALPSAADVVALDEGGKLLSSREFARNLGQSRDLGAPALALVIGGPDGLAPSLCASARLALSFGPMTFPHNLVKIMAAEQIYRAVTILAGHPYHRD